MFTLYILIILVSSGLLIFPPDNFDAKQLVIPLIAFLFISSIRMSHHFARSQNKLLTLVGTFLIAILMTLIGFFLVAGVAWCVALYHAR